MSKLLFLIAMSILVCSCEELLDEDSNSNEGNVVTQPTDNRDYWLGTYVGMVSQSGLNPTFLENTDRLKINIVNSNGPIGTYGTSANEYSIGIRLSNDNLNVNNLSISKNTLKCSASGAHPYEFSLARSTDNNGETRLTGYFKYFTVNNSTGQLVQSVHFYDISVYK